MHCPTFEPFGIECPSLLISPIFEVGREGLNYIEGEFNEVLSGIYSLLKDAFWINNPLEMRLIHRKLYQLKVARSLVLAPAILPV